MQTSPGVDEGAYRQCAVIVMFLCYQQLHSYIVYSEHMLHFSFSLKTPQYWLVTAAQRGNYKNFIEQKIIIVVQAEDINGEKDGIHRRTPPARLHQ